MEYYVFKEENITQHIVQYGVDIRPGLVPKADVPHLQSYANWLSEEFQEAFESQYCAPKEFRITKQFLLPGNKGKAEIPTFTVTDRGVAYLFPIKLFTNGIHNRIHEIELPDKDLMFRKALAKLRTTFPTRKIIRVGVIHEIVFDTGSTDSVDIVFSAIRKEMWRSNLIETIITLKYVEDGKNRMVQLTPVQIAEQAQPNGYPKTETPRGYGIQVKVDINNVDVTKDMKPNEIAGVLAAAEDFAQEKLMRFLNGGEL